jgi:CubicO group peptidase (beta-lactamase class C family)
MLVAVDDADAPFVQPYAIYGVADLNKFMYGYKPSSAPNGTFKYSNLGYGMLGWAIELVEDGSEGYTDLVTEVIAGPLKMPDTVAYLSPEKKQRMMPTFLAPSGNSPKPIQVQPIPWDSSVLTAADGLKSTLPDMINFVQANMAATGPPDSAALQKINVLNFPLLEASMKKAQEWRVGYNLGEQRGVGLGWGIEKWSTKSGNSSLIWHSGSTYGSSVRLADYTI